MIDYTGYKTLDLSASDWGNLYHCGKLDNADFLENEYLITPSGGGAPSTYFKYQDEKFKEIRFPTIENEYIGTIKPRNAEQICAMDMLLDNKSKIKLITGCFGSGKSLFCIAFALSELTKGNYDQIVFVRNNVQVKDTDQLGALPGSELDKMLPYVMPMADHCGGVDGIKMLIDSHKLEVVPLGFLRGRSIRNSIIYSMESENLTKEHIQLLIGRVDEGSILLMDGDIKQRDKSAFEKSKGLELMVERLKGDPLFGYTHLIRSERSPVARLADKLD